MHLSCCIKKAEIPANTAFESMWGWGVNSSLYSQKLLSDKSERVYKIKGGFLVANQGYSTAPQVYSAAFQGYSTAPQVYSVAFQGCSTAPQVYSVAFQGCNTAPQGYSVAFQGCNTAPQGYSVALQGCNTAPQGYSVAFQGYNTALQGCNAVLQDDISIAVLSGVSTRQEKKTSLRGTKQSLKFKGRQSC